jgi:glycogen debranching enzyme
VSIRADGAGDDCRRRHPVAAHDDVEIRVGPPVVVVHDDDQFLVTSPDGSIDLDEQQGYFVADTRLVSRYAVELNGTAPVLVNSAALSTYGARYELTNGPLRGPTPADDVPEHTVHLRIDRSIGQGVHEDYDVANHSGSCLELALDIRCESDFADLSEVKSRDLRRRGTVESAWHDGELRTTYRSDGFERGLVVRVERSDARARYANGTLTLHFVLEPGATRHACVLWAPLEGDRAAEPPERCHELVGRRRARRWATLTTDDPEVDAITERAVRDLEALAIRLHDRPTGASREEWIPAAGIPWFVTLFGRDALIVTFQTAALGPRLALGSLDALATLQADEWDDWRDMAPGKIEHEVRRGELATRRAIPQLPYYGASDAPSLFVRSVAESWRWHGDRAALDRLRPHVERALRWIDEDGDLDGDGLQEYRTRSTDGMYNQSWKDSSRAIVHADGTRASLPIATCELQGYVVAAKESWAGVLEDAYRDPGAARRLRDAAARQRDTIEDRLWWGAERTYYLGLDGDKRPIESVASNPGHLLWSGAIPAERARLVASRLTADDMWSGWGVRTLSSRHVAYNPLSYQLGSVWPHDNALFVSGLLRYHRRDEAALVARALFDAAARFQGQRLPEVFAGIPREPASFPAQYLGANVPQAWAAGAVVHMLSAFLGLEPDASSRHLFVDPWLPPWLEQLAISDLGVGDARCDVAVQRRDAGVEIEVDVRHGDLRFSRRDGG